MKILHIINHTNRLSGNVHAAVDLACAQAQAGHEVAVCSAGGDFDDLLNQWGVEVLVLDQSRNSAAVLLAFKRFADLVRRWSPDVVHAHMVTSVLVAWPATRLHRVRLVSTVHNAFARSAVLMGVADRVIAVSGAVRKNLEKRGVRKDKLHVVLNGTVGSVRQPLPAPEPARLERPAVLYVGGLHPRKGISDLIQAMKIVHRCRSDAVLYLAGNGPMNEQYQAEAAGCDYIRFVGATEDPREYLLAADLFVLASHQDPAPLVISEAREAGCAIVATNVDGIPELLDAGRAGLLVPPHSPIDLAAAIQRVLETPEILQAQKDAALNGVEALSIARVAKETVWVYSS